MRFFFILAITLSFSGLATAYHKDNNQADIAKNSPSTNMRTTGNIISDNGTRGELLYKNHCRVCHESNVHMRENRRAKSMKEVISWIQRWSSHLKLDWDNDEIQDVAQHLNETYYKFKP